MTPLPVLVVDDYPASIIALQALLANVAPSTIAACSGAEAIALAELHDFSLILMDVQMPELNGLEAMRRIRAGARNKSTPVLLMTAADADAAERFRGDAAGEAELICKPFDIDGLRDKVRALMLTRQGSATGAQHTLSLSKGRITRTRHALEVWSVDGARYGLAGTPVEREWAKLVGATSLPQLRVEAKDVVLASEDLGGGLVRCTFAAVELITRATALEHVLLD